MSAAVLSGSCADTTVKTGAVSEFKSVEVAGSECGNLGPFEDSKKTAFCPDSTRGSSKKFAERGAKKSQFRPGQRRAEGVIDNALSRAADGPRVIDNAIPPAVKEKLQMLRLEFETTRAVQDWRGRWWGGLTINDRRLLLALCGCDDSEQSASRSWSVMPESVRLDVARECARVARLLEPMRRA